MRRWDCTGRSGGVRGGGGVGRGMETTFDPVSLGFRAVGVVKGALAVGGGVVEVDGDGGVGDGEFVELATEGMPRSCG